MKKLVAINIFLIFVFYSCKQKRLDKEVMETWGNGSTKLEIQWINKQDSTFIEVGYFETNKISNERIYIKGKQEKFVGYYETGEIEGLCFFNNGKNISCTEYYKNGQKKGNVPRELNGKINGHVKYYYENGTTRSEGEYKYDKPVGIWYNYNQKGKIVRVDTLN